MPKIRLSHVHALKILRLIYDRSSVSRAEIIERTGYSAFLISKLCDRLLRGGFISEAGFGESTGGRRPTLLSVKSGLGHLIGIHMGTVNVRVVLTDIVGNVVEYVKAPSHTDEGPEVAIPRLLSLLDEILRKAAISHQELRGIGAGISGVLDRASGTTLFWPKRPLWVNVPIRKILQERYNTTVQVEDTPRTMALAEQRFGGAQSAKQFIFLLLGAGIGAALFFDGQLYTGSGGFAGEFGHMMIAEGGPLCSCGNRGCLEALVSASTLIQKAQQAISLGVSNHLLRLAGGDARTIAVETVAQAARDGDRFSLRLLSEAGTQLAIGIVGLINLLNPELIVLGGGLSVAVGDLLLPEIDRVVKDRAMIQPAGQVQLQLSKLQEMDWARGSALLVAGRALEEMFLDSAMPERRSSRKRKRRTAK